MSLGIVDAVVLGVVEGLTEFLPVSSTGHLTLAEGLLGLDVDDPAVTAFTAVIQVGAIASVLLYFRKDIAALARAFFGGLRTPSRRDSEFRFAVSVLIGSLPIGVVGLAARDLIEGPLRSLAVVGIALIAWSAVMVYAERNPSQEKDQTTATTTDVLVVGLVQCVALIPGVSRSGATISAGLLRGIDRVTATRLSFFLAIPALTAAGALQLPEALDSSIGLGPVVVGTVVSFVVAYASVAFLLRFVAKNSIVAFVPYRVVVGAAVLAWLALR